MAGFAPFNHESFRGPNNEPIWLRLPVAVLTSLTVWQYLCIKPLLSAIRIANPSGKALLQSLGLPFRLQCMSG